LLPAAARHREPGAHLDRPVGQHLPRPVVRHAAFKYDDPRGKKLPGADKSFRRIPNGVPGVETRLPLLFSEGVNKGRITLQQFVG